MGDLAAVYVRFSLPLLAQVPNFALAVLVEREDQITTRRKLRHPLVSTLPNAIHEKIRELKEREREREREGNSQRIESKESIKVPRLTALAATRMLAKVLC